MTVVTPVSSTPGQVSSNASAHRSSMSPPMSVSRCTLIWSIDGEPEPMVAGCLSGLAALDAVDLEGGVGGDAEGDQVGQRDLGGDAECQLAAKDQVRLVDQEEHCPYHQGDANCAAMHGAVQQRMPQAAPHRCAAGGSRCELVPGAALAPWPIAPVL